MDPNAYSENKYPKIINLSSKNLTEAQIRLLNFGPKFTPSPKQDIDTLNNDIKDFCQKLRLVEYFHNQPKIQSESLVKNKGTFNPGRNREPILDTYIDCLSKTELEPPKKQQNNLSREEWDALKQLKEDKTIIIKEADKGGAFVLMDSKYYEKKDENTTRG